ncbi:cell division protein FtsA [Candidatus Shapirobacteria bacterium CG03_land_8_20_14_0_80_39_12]|uniref:Cell division protein FtsA n=1 Tax=Candidatus Shapirobacteria bacterium CG03_land_8_20_14_0_80_39_12 TaxID=1974879 RepID=A0A2M7BDW9_9BACT|nr:MAG: cell division protein FtsA [Candidatus Shapirobacteria bacterium CG03_land_8_20_14_0_80_39_12]
MNRNKVIADIDVGSIKVSTIIGQPNEDGERINVVGVSSIPSLGIRKGQIVNIEEAADVIVKSVEAAERMAGFSLSKIFVSVGGAHISSQNSHGVVAVAEPQGEIIPDDVRRVIEAARAISLPSSREILHIIPRTYTVDSQEGVADPIGMSGVRLEVETHIITGSTTAIKNLSKCVSEVGANVEAMVFSGIASAEAVLTETERELGVVLVDVGGGTTSVVLFLEGAPAYTAVLPIGARNVTNDLAIGLRLSLEGAEKLKISLSEKVKKPSEEEVPLDEDEVDLNRLGIYEETKKVSKKTIVEGIIRPRLNEIFNMVGAEIQRSGFAGLTPSGVVLTGGGASTVRAAEACRKSLSLPVRIGIPDKVTGLVDDILDPAFASAIGLLVYGNKNSGGISFNSTFSKYRSFGKKIPIKGLAEKIGNFVKSFLP